MRSIAYRGHRAQQTNWKLYRSYCIKLAILAWFLLGFSKVSEVIFYKPHIIQAVAASQVVYPEPTKSKLLDFMPANPDPKWHEVVDSIKKIAPIYDFPIKIAIAQAALESRRGTSNHAKDRNNYFGLGAYTNNPDAAMRFDNAEQCIIAYMQLIKNKFPLAYAQRDNPQRMIELIKAGNYATDPDYIVKVTSLPEWTD